MSCIWSPWDPHWALFEYAAPCAICACLPSSLSLDTHEPTSHHDSRHGLYFPRDQQTRERVQRWTIGWALGCVNAASWLYLAVGRKFMQTRAHLIA